MNSLTATYYILSQGNTERKYTAYHTLLYCAALIIKPTINKPILSRFKPFYILPCTNYNKRYYKRLERK